jgi:uncharacterized protein (DUF983 family)
MIAMMSILKVFIGLAGEHKLKLSMTRIEDLTAQLITMLIIGMFLTTLAAIVAAVGLFSLYQSLVTAGFGTLSSGLIVSLVLLGIMTAGMIILTRYMKSIRAGLKTVARFETPVVGPVVGQVSNVAQSFVSGLLKSQDRKAKMPQTPSGLTSVFRKRSL